MGLLVILLKDAGSGQPGVVAAVGDRPRVVVRVELVKEHGGYLGQD